MQNDVYITVDGAVAEYRPQESCSFLLSDHHTVILKNNNTGRRRLRCADIFLTVFQYVKLY